MLSEHYFFFSSFSLRLTKRLALMKQICCKYPYLLLLEDDVALEGDLITQIREIVTKNEEERQTDIIGAVGTLPLHMHTIYISRESECVAVENISDSKQQNADQQSLPSIILQTSHNVIYLFFLSFSGELCIQEVTTIALRPRHAIQLHVSPYVSRPPELLSPCFFRRFMRWGEAYLISLKGGVTREKLDVLMINLTQ